MKRINLALLASVALLAPLASAGQRDSTLYLRTGSEQSLNRLRLLAQNDVADLALVLEARELLPAAREAERDATERGRVELVLEGLAGTSYLILVGPDSGQPAAIARVGRLDADGRGRVALHIPERVREAAPEMAIFVLLNPRGANPLARPGQPLASFLEETVQSIGALPLPEPIDQTEREVPMPKPVAVERSPSSRREAAQSSESAESGQALQLSPRMAPMVRLVAQPGSANRRTGAVPMPRPVSIPGAIDERQVPMPKPPSVERGNERRQSSASGGVVNERVDFELIDVQPLSPPALQPSRHRGSANRRADAEPMPLPAPIPSVVDERQVPMPRPTSVERDNPRRKSAAVGGDAGAE